jgi:hypothetical protein
MVKTLCYKPEGRGFDEVNDFFNLPNPSGSEVHLAPNINEYQKQKNNVSGE